MIRVLFGFILGVFAGGGLSRCLSLEFLNFFLPLMVLSVAVFWLAVEVVVRWPDDKKSASKTPINDGLNHG
jgi:uncharacterized membrane protein